MVEAREKVAVRLSPAALAEVDRLAAKEERTRSDMLRVLLKAGMEAYAKRR